MHADIFSKKAPKIPLDQKDLIKLEIRRSDADAFYVFQSEKTEFMVTNELCPNFNYKATKAQQDSATIHSIHLMRTLVMVWTQIPYISNLRLHLNM